MFSYNLVETSIGFSYYLAENIRFTIDLAETRVLFTSATSFTPKKRAPLPPLAAAKKPCESWSHLFVTLCVPTKPWVSPGCQMRVSGMERTRSTAGPLKKGI